MSEGQQPARMAPLSRLPIFLSLAGKSVALAGGNAAAAWKAELLSAAGAEVNVFSPTLSEEMKTIAAMPPDGRIVLHLRAWEAKDLANSVLAVAACEDDVDAARFAATARAANIPYNVIDKPAFCGFAFGAVVNRSPLVIGISTDGAAPVFAQAIRTKIEAMLPAGFARWMNAAHGWRAAIKRSGLSFAGRRRFWQLFAARAFNHPDHAPGDADFDLLLSNTYREAGDADAGSVSLVGTGPGDPELLTLRAARALRSADVILFDERISPEILDFSRREAKKLLVRSIDDDASDRPTTSTLAVTFARSGKRVVRLMAGDPNSSIGATAEISAYHKAGVTLEVIPGVAEADGRRSDATIDADRDRGRPHRSNAS